MWGWAMKVVEGSFHGPADRRSALDRAHRGDIEGALGRIASHDTAPRRSLRRRALTMAAILGPGLIVLVADNDAGGLAVYAQAGQDHGLRLLWVLLLLAPVLFVNQEMAARLGAVSGSGHARLIFERFGRRWGAFALTDLLVLNVLMVVTDFVGVAMALGVLGVSRYVAVPLAAAFLLLVTSGGGYRRWERAMLAMVCVDVLLIPLAILAHGARGPVPVTAVMQGGVRDTALLVVALVGTTAAPWQLFLQQSSVVDKRITARWLAYARLDTAIGTVAMVAGAATVTVVCAVAFGGTPLAGHFAGAGAVAYGLSHIAGSAAGAIFAAFLLNASLLGASAVSWSSAYAVGEVFGLKHSLHRGWGDAHAFHAMFACTVVAGAVVVLLPAIPIRMVTTAVQALAGALLPSASVFLLLLCNDAAVLGPRTNPRWLNALGALAVGVIMVLSAMLAVTTVFPHADIRIVVATLSGVAAVAFAVWAGVLIAEGRRRGGHGGGGGVAGWWERWTWTMPALDTLDPPALTRGRAIGLMLLRGYVLVAVAFTIARVVELAR